jgi:hypothetical protein
MRDEMRDMREIEGGSKEVKLSHSPERNAGAGEEIFIFPITDEGVLRSYLTRPGAEEFLVAFAFSGALQDALAAEGILAIQNDTRDSEGEGPHFKGDFRVIVNIKEWRGIFFGGPPCFQHLRADEDCLEHKIADGRAFFAGLVVFYCICAGWALMRVVEQPDTICYDILDPAVDGSGVALFEVSSTQFGDSWHKSGYCTNSASTSTSSGNMTLASPAEPRCSNELPKVSDRPRPTFKPRPLNQNRTGGFGPSSFGL